MESIDEIDIRYICITNRKCNCNIDYLQLMNADTFKAHNTCDIRKLVQILLILNV